MARVTKAEREQRIAESRAAYPELLMKTLERATAVNFNIKVQDGAFVITQDDCYGGYSWVLTPDYTKQSGDSLFHLCVVVGNEEEANRERDRNLELKQAALAKLTPEERTVLGLN